MLLFSLDVCTILPSRHDAHGKQVNGINNASVCSCQRGVIQKSLCVLVIVKSRRASIALNVFLLKTIHF